VTVGKVPKANDGHHFFRNLAAATTLDEPTPACLPVTLIRNVTTDRNALRGQPSGEQ
jgi:hypothetical protein